MVKTGQEILYIRSPTLPAGVLTKVGRGVYMWVSNIAYNAQGCPSLAPTF